jgi:hypothetical protein
MDQDTKSLLPGILLLDDRPMDLGDSVENVLHMVLLGHGAGSEGKVGGGITGEHHTGTGTVELVGGVADGANS